MQNKENCYHQNFYSVVEVSRLGDGKTIVATDFIANITIHCTDCGEPFHFRGVDFGHSLMRPMVEVGGLELRAPIKPGRIKTVPARIIYETADNELIEEGEIS